MEHDLHSEIKVAIGIGSTDGRDAGASTVSAIIDTADYESFEWLIDFGTITTGTFSATIEDGDDSGLSDNAAVPAADIIGGSPTWIATDDDQVRRVGIVSKKRYQRFTLVGASTPVADVCVMALLGNPVTKPVPDQQTTS